MSSQQEVIYGLMNELEEALDKGFPLLGYHFTVVKKDTVTSILDKLPAPGPISSTKVFLSTLAPSTIFLIILSSWIKFWPKDFLNSKLSNILSSPNLQIV